MLIVMIIIVIMIKTNDLKVNTIYQANIEAGRRAFSVQGALPFNELLEEAQKRNIINKI